MVLSVGRTRFLPSGATAIIAALTLISVALQGGQGASAAAAGPITPAYVRIIVSEKTSVYLVFQGSEVRAAMSAEGLKVAAPIKLGALESPQEITLPIPADQLPAGITAVKASFTLYPHREKVSGPGALTSIFLVRMSICQIGICRTDEHKAEWEYVVQDFLQPAGSADEAWAIRLPSLDKLAISVEGRSGSGTLGVGARLLAGTTELIEVRKDGKPVEMQVAVLDASGKKVASKKGPLTDFGFS